MSQQSGKVGADRDDCERALNEVFREFFDDDNLVMRPEMTAHDVDGWDSLANIRLLLTLERKFHIKFSASEVGGLKNVGDLVTLIVNKMK